MNFRWPPPEATLARGLATLAAILLEFILLVLALALAFPRAHAAGLVGRYVQLLAVTNEGRVSVVHDLTAAECGQVVGVMRDAEMAVNYRLLACLPIDYDVENKRR